MPQSKSSSPDIQNFIPSVLILAFLCLGFIPNWQAVDKIAPQWLAMSILNLITVVYIFSRRTYFKVALEGTLKTVLSLLYMGFILWAALSYFYAINPTEVLVNITRQFNVLLMYLHMGILIYKLRAKAVLVCYAIAGILVIEVYEVLDQALTMVQTNGSISPSELKGVTANRNITAFSLAIKLPFVLFLIYQSKKQLFKLLMGSLVFVTLFGLTMIQSRASFLAAAFILIAFIVLNVALYFYENRQKQHLFRIGYYVIPLVLALMANQLLLSDKGADAVSRAGTISVNTKDGSVNQRLRYYKDVLTHLKSNPIFGVGLGNWKLESIYYDREDIVGYVVPYHAHSDFIQLGAELGVVGFLLYLSVFIMAVLFGWRLIRDPDLGTETKVFIFLLLTALGVYSIDANLNFPIARPQVLVVWTLFMALINYYFFTHISKTKSVQKHLKLPVVYFLMGLIGLLPCVYITQSVYKSHKGQMYLLRDFNTNKYTVPLDQIDHIVPDIPNITVTTIPLQSIKARYYLQHKKYDKALKLLNEGTSANPYLHFSEYLKSQIFLAQGRLDSAYHHGRKAFFNLPNNNLHSSNYLNLLSKRGDRKAIEETFELLTQKNNLINWKNYLIISAQVTPPGDSLLVERVKKAVEIFPEDTQISQLHRLILLGNNRINEGVAVSNTATELFNQGAYDKASEKYETAVALNPLDYAHRENAATSYYMAGNYAKAMTHINVVIKEMNPGTGKCEYLKALLLIQSGDTVGACDFLKIAQERGYTQAEATLNQNCKNL